MKKIIIYVLSLLILFGNFEFSNVVSAQEPAEDSTELSSFSISSIDDEEEEGQTVFELLLEAKEALEFRNQMRAASKKDGDEAFELGFMISHGLLNEPVGSWHEGSFDFPAMSIVFHYKKHGKEVKAKSAASYLNKAREFRTTAKKGVKPTKVKGEVDGVKRYRKNGKYIDLAPDNRIVSFGTTKK
ncbi:hypothetical protein [Exiguobacterium sp. s78]|uniref:hypothetical protein n=1 Tax=Exiguobacterium sp. s78 TaxID=2751197 RepID=UPI001BE4E75B|nr:hypothetical protein [Exiguobacterium sp. s78]